MASVTNTARSVLLVSNKAVRKTAQLNKIETAFMAGEKISGAGFLKLCEKYRMGLNPQTQEYFKNSVGKVGLTPEHKNPVCLPHGGLKSVFALQMIENLRDDITGMDIRDMTATKSVRLDEMIVSTIDLKIFDECQDDIELKYEIKQFYNEGRRTPLTLIYAVCTQPGKCILSITWQDIRNAEAQQRQELLTFGKYVKLIDELKYLLERKKKYE
jgi:hypothetical protein